MKRLLLASLLILTVQPALAECGLRRGDGSVSALSELPEGISRGQAICDGTVRPMAVWTIAVDGGAPDLGIRDRPLLQSSPANPLIEVAEAFIDDARITVFRRRTTPSHGAGPDARRPFRFFGTLCDAGSAEPLDCFTGPARVRIRANVVDADGDGVLDLVRHQLSIWDGADRLQVLMFDTEHAVRPLSNAAVWIEALRFAGRL